MAAIIKRFRTARSILNWLKTVDGAGSGLDADLLDGSQGDAYAKLTGATFTGGVNLIAANPFLVLTDSDTGADSRLTANSGTGSFAIQVDYNNEVANSNFKVAVDGTDILTLTGGGGAQVGSPTGGNKGVGSINAVTVYENNNRVAVLSGAAFTGAVSIAAALSLNVAGDVSVFNRTGSDGIIMSVRRDGVQQGGITISGSTVNYIGAHLSRWSQWGDGDEPAEPPLRGTVLSNLDQKCVWIAERWFDHDEHFETVEAKRVSSAVRHELYDGALRPGDTYLDDHGQPHKIVQEDNEQLNCVKVSDTDMDRDFGGILDTIDDDGDLVVATRGEFLVRIAAGVSVQRGDMLVSAGDGTARPLDPDTPMTARTFAAIIGKVMTAEITEIYADGSYLVPVLL